MKVCINIQNLFEIQNGINPRPYLETLVFGILYGSKYLTAMDAITHYGIRANEGYSRNKSQATFSRLACKVSSPYIRSASVHVSFW